MFNYLLPNKFKRIGWALIDIWSYILPHVKLSGNQFFDTPMGLLYMSALFYHINFRGLLRDEK
jgi:hypothetical protein